MNKGFDVKKIREEIDKKKSQSQLVNVNGSQITVPRTGDAFLRDLVTSLNTGRPSDSVKKMQLVEQVAEDKKPSGIKRKSSAGFSSENIHSLINTTSTNEEYKPTVSPETIYEDREELMVKKMMQENNSLANKYKNGVADVSHLVQEFYGNKPVKQVISSNQPQSTMGQINTNYINEEIDRKFNNYINENMDGILESGMKNTIIEMFSKERVKAVLMELDIEGMIRECVIRTIKQLQERKKQKVS